MKSHLWILLLMMYAQGAIACNANFSSGILGREFMGTHSVSQDSRRIEINEDGKGSFGPLGLRSCTLDKAWHCLKAPGFFLYIPRGNEKKALWSYGGYRFIMTESKLTLLNKKQNISVITSYALDAKEKEGTREPHGIYFFNEKMELIGYSTKESLGQESESVFFTYYLSRGVLPLSCY